LGGREFVAEAQENDENCKREDQDARLVRKECCSGGEEYREECKLSVVFEKAEGREKAEQQKEEAKRIGSCADPCNSFGVNRETEPEKRG
jgi:hypothetical protein